MAILQRSNVRHRQRCEMFGCNNLATHQIGRNPKSVAYTMRICDECLMEMKRIAEGVLAKKIALETPKTVAQQIAELPLGFNETVTIEPAEKLPFEPENDVSPEASTGEEMNNNPSDENSIEGENPEKMQFFKLKAYAKSKGVDVEKYKTKPEMLAELEKLGE